MNILITGITGLFGSQLAKEFGALGKIHGLKRENSSLDMVEGLDIQWHIGELSNTESLLETLAGMDLVIHSAGLVSFSARDKEKLYEVNTIGTANLVNAMLATGVKKLIHVSSVSAIGRSPELSVIDEEFKWVESPWNTEYAVSKYWAELEAWRGEQEGLELILINPSVLLGKVSYGKSSTAIYSYVMEEGNFFPKGDLNYIDVRDAAKITRELVESQAWGERFILNKESISYQEFFSEIATVFGKKEPRFPLSDGLISIASFTLSLLRAFGLSKSPLNKQTAMLSQQKIRFDNAKIERFLNFRYFSLRESLEWAKTP
ncbi:NAD-dependent epimerase/dehydratase family protein [Algoriphagus sp.]|uniref:NAD-dependent epimerase/dehydratase family protein n=1 Tax=Algoriphagus sp. TaxID=1872435 RepID=UPI002722CC22|nr:NAD-dependent epimerase/dehydratase family protein [Algoriphagus sp.]MDO8966472.1 NAD-dependent epimerase/dehydratase family protein [Algoriphagus sp.]MDP3201918.1 NAD-dependent epimerase/dehydratase family protein [Algoriphagus sp.]